MRPGQQTPTADQPADQVMNPYLVGDARRLGIDLASGWQVGW